MPSSKKGDQRNARLVIRLLMIGDSSVGKTSLVIRYDEDEFSTKYMTTIGVDYRDKFIQVEGREIKLQIWDTAGQERFRSLTANFFGKADGFVVCFDISNRGTFNHVRNWIHDVQQHKRGEVDVALCGCKCDLSTDQRQVSFDEAQALARQYGVPYYEASAKENTNVKATFEDLAQKVVQRKLQETNQRAGPGGGITLRDDEDEPSNKCAC